MSDKLTARLNQILPTITSDAFLGRRSLSGEIAFYVFDYPAESELRIRQHIDFLLEHVPKLKPKIKLAHLNLFSFLVEYLEEEGVLEKTLDIQRVQGNEAAMEALKGLLEERTIAQRFADVVDPNSKDLVLVSGVGSVHPLLESHTLLSNLHPIVTKPPLVMFYPGNYDGKSLRLFGRIHGDGYYRAFRLIP